MRIHFIAIGGSAMHNLAIALHKKGMLVTGSDDFIFEPSASRLARYGLFPSESGWRPEVINRQLDAVILGMHARADNPELLRAQELGLRIYSYPEYIYEQSKDKFRVVIGGSHGKTTITSMILHVLNYYNHEIDYLVGAQLEGFDTMVKLTDSAPVIIIEGDEYLSSAIDRRPKFHLYNANLAVISGVAWDHVNVFPTFENYLTQFSIFIDTIMPDGELIFCEDDAELVKMVNEKKNLKATGYQIPLHAIENGITHLEPGHQELKIFGNHNLMNLSAARQVCERLGISIPEFNEAIKSFKGASKRLELLFSDENTNVYKDFAHSPSKLKATIEAVKTQFEERKLVACIELHTFSSLNKKFLLQYHDTMFNADNPIVYIDKKTFEQKNIIPFSETDIKNAFNDKRITYFDNADNLAQYLLELDFSHTNLLLMSSGNYGGMDLGKLARELNNN
ncbi:UDP-N-acetylmuramate: L-alanyl-gamma-D-glutamyl-meso-diaminopimelate ligase [Pedobacter antarcticus]|uniref:UDP-N-acetylmuramate: L-alanyl-gamma-D-glutamyl-meso-diaminopimelate ligase n=1 Tax=Pedobacter antarcticus TaxID=34086 RepID=A0A1I2DY50_9SPHI|nr:Mur ligase family protein [Pedobacter antarcticus]SFE85357.1 UDP-N-acetylmuramate: L-alanyl-gamma-D-glutamyl-meso-diaminopimelate ligase [Pedobacter antarcticus]